MMRLFVILFTLLGFTRCPKNDLRKKPTREDYINEIKVWIQVNFTFIALAAIIMVIVFFVWFCFFLVGVSATGEGIFCLEKVV